MADTTTFEEANCRAMPWIRQRARWLKGYALTWAVHMRNPALLWRELGPWQFLGFQVVFIGTMLLFLLAPLMWTLLALPLGLAHPAEALPSGLLLALVALFIGAELVNLVGGAYGEGPVAERVGADDAVLFPDGRAGELPGAFWNRAGPHPVGENAARVVA